MAFSRAVTMRPSVPLPGGVRGRGPLAATATWRRDVSEDRRPAVSAPVVGGVDGPPSSLEAVDLAAREARLRGRGLKVVHAFDLAAYALPLGPSPLGPAERGGLRNQVDKMMAEAVERARSVAPEVEVTNAVVTGEPLTVLRLSRAPPRWSWSAARGMGGFVGLLLGSTAVHLTAHARCPVMVVRPPVPPSGWCWGSTAHRRATRRSSSPSRKPPSAAPASLPCTLGLPGAHRQVRRRTHRCPTIRAGHARGR